MRDVKVLSQGRISMTVDQDVSDCQMGAARLTMVAEKLSVDIHASGVYAIYRDE
jgi:Flp pilus assembly secretin CpaC